jgi:predicted secreted protein
MKASFIALSCIVLGVAACAPQGKKLSANSTGLAPVASGPTTPATKAAVVSEAQKGQTIGIYKDGTLTVTLEAAQQNGYAWRLSEIPDPTVLKLVSKNYAAPASGQGRGEEKWVFQAVGPGDVDVKMWYGNLRETALTGNSNFDFVASVSDQPEPPQNVKHSAKRP